MPSTAPQTSREPSTLGTAVPWLIAVSAVIGCIGLAIWSTSLRSDIADANDRIAALVAERNQLRQAATATTHNLTPTAQGPQSASGTMYLSASGSGVLNVVNMPQADDGSRYQIWFLPDNEGEPIPGSTFTVDERGVGFTLIPADTGPFRGISISQEPASGSERPSGPMLLTGAASGARG